MNAPPAKRATLPKAAKSSRPTVLVIGDAVAPTGFARVLYSILERLLERYDFHHLGVNYRGDPHDFPWKIYPAAIEGDFWGERRLQGLIRRLAPRLVFSVNDIWIQAGYMDRLQELAEETGERVKVVLYCPVDAGPIEPETMLRLDGVDRLVAYTRFGRRVMEASIAAARQERPEVALPREVPVIPHGIDTDRFYPLVDGSGDDPRAVRRAARRRLFPRQPELHDAFLVLNANRNQPRKRIDVTMKGFALFARDKPPEVKLYLHMGVEDLGWNVTALARRYGIEERLVLTGKESYTPAVTDEVLNRIYNACEVGLNTSVGEGWGLVTFEHAATRAAQVVPRHSACEELWSGSAVLLEPAVTLVAERILTEWKLVTPEETAAGLERLYADRELLERMSAAAYATARRPEYGWDRIAERWDALFLEVLAEPPRRVRRRRRRGAARRG